MTTTSDDQRFYIAILASPDESGLIADIVYAGQQVADVRLINGTCTVSLYGDAGLSLPLEQFCSALKSAADRIREIEA